jgi:hypothetical protein
VLLGEVDRRRRLLSRFAACFTDSRDPRRVGRPDPAALAEVKILARADSGFAREELMSRCEQQGAGFFLGQETDCLACSVTIASMSPSGTGQGS